MPSRDTRFRAGNQAARGRRTGKRVPEAVKKQLAELILPLLEVMEERDSKPKLKKGLREALKAHPIGFWNKIIWPVVKTVLATDLTLEHDATDTVLDMLRERYAGRATGDTRKKPTSKAKGKPRPKRKR